MKKLLAIAGLCTAMGFAGARPAEAGFLVFIDDSTTSTPTSPDGAYMLAIDNNTGCVGCNTADFSGSPGGMVLTGSLGTWSFVLTGATSKPLTGAQQPTMDLNFQVTSEAAGNLRIWVTDTDFTTALQTFDVEFNGNGQNGTVSAAGWQDPANGQFTATPGTLLFTCPAMPLPGGFDCDRSGLLSAGTYSVTSRITISHTGAGTSSGDLLLTSAPVPEPATLSLLGMGLLTIGARARRRFGRKN